ncbi:MAG TPA: hypothetical protein VHX68_07885 [Planctomycetaceae bacterium]|nr:hypothetical protein [Planctomycetaceae bacterium]
MKDLYPWSLHRNLPARQANELRENDPPRKELKGTGVVETTPVPFNYPL